VRLSVATVLVFLFVFYVVLPLVASHRAEVTALAHIHPAYLALGVLLELAALTAYAQLTHAMLPAGGPRRLRLFRINLSTLSLSHVAPGGTAPGAALGYRLLTQSGVAPSDAGFALGTQGIGSAVVLNALFWLALVGFLVTHGFHVPVSHRGGGSASSLVLVAAVVGAVLALLFGAATFLVTRGPARVRTTLERIGRRLPFVDPERVVGFFEGIARRFGDLMADRSLTRRAVGWAAANWLLDAASLWVFVAAFGHVISPVDLLCAYGLANILAAIPITPAGLGLVELVLVSMLTGFGPTAAQALSGVLAYRAVNFWLPIPVGGLAYASLELERRDVHHRLRARLRRQPVPTSVPGRPPAVTASSTVPFRFSHSVGVPVGDVTDGWALSGRPAAPGASAADRPSLPWAVVVATGTQPLPSAGSPTPGEATRRPPGRGPRGGDRSSRHAGRRGSGRPDGPGPAPSSRRDRATTS
jgi:uncharacterized protein (TIRG00374 family)